MSDGERCEKDLLWFFFNQKSCPTKYSWIISVSQKGLLFPKPFSGDTVGNLKTFLSVVIDCAAEVERTSDRIDAARKFYITFIQATCEQREFLSETKGSLAPLIYSDSGN